MFYFKKNMRLLFFPIIFAVMTTGGYAQEYLSQPVSAVPFIDFNRYAGLWYEVARLPNRFQEQCAGDVTATYTLLGDGRLKIVNRCRQENGDISEAEGVGKQSGDDTLNTKLKVRFAPGFLSFLPFVWGDYWIINLAADYSYAVVGEPSRKYLWVLSRTPAMNDSTLSSILDQVKAEGYDLTSLIKTKQSGK